MKCNKNIITAHILKNRPQTDRAYMQYLHRVIALGEHRGYRDRLENRKGSIIDRVCKLIGFHKQQ